MIKYCELEAYVTSNNIDKDRDLFALLGEFIENHKNPHIVQKKNSTPIIYNKDIEFTFEQVVELLSS